MKIKEYKSVLTDNGVVLKECGFHVADNRQRFDNPSALANFFSESVGIGCCAYEVFTPSGRGFRQADTLERLYEMIMKFPKVEY